MTIRVLLVTVTASLAVAGCANKYDALTPELQASFMTDLQAGKMNLDCGERCSLTWLAQAPTIHPLDMSENWTALASRVMQIDYGNDLAYYYLGQSAQGLGYHRAAIAYYSQSLALATGRDPLAKCTALASASNDPCQGVDLIGSIPVLVQASRDAIAKQEMADAAAAAPAPVVHHHHRSSTAASGGTGWVAPPPAVTNASATVPATATPAASTGWSAPPPPASQ